MSFPPRIRQIAVYGEEHLHAVRRVNFRLRFVMDGGEEYTQMQQRTHRIPALMGHVRYMLKSNIYQLTSRFAGWPPRKLSNDPGNS